MVEWPWVDMVTRPISASLVNLMISWLAYPTPSSIFTLAPVPASFLASFMATKMAMARIWLISI